MNTTNRLTQKEAHEKIERLIADKYYKQVYLADIMGISYRTFWDRRKNANWTGKEIDVITGL